ncbi:MAG: Gfo/Idh/MocA family oxidoreductase [Defluviitaleaceae bacterium]|nr:Gfo/Idh/MocA family oxidoreductase [Defluviitaleaceae bacterium]
MKKKVNVAVIGTKFMGKAHSNGWLAAPKFFDLPYEPVLKMVCARDTDAAGEFAENWGYEQVEGDWRKAIESKDIDIIDICAPTYLHKEMALAAADAGKHIYCEKPCALNCAEAVEMAEAADKAGVMHYLNHNYRRVPAVALAKKIIGDGKIGEIYHWRGAYLQDWIMDPQFPLTWQLQRGIAGAGPHYDLNSHSVDLARYLVGEIASVSAIFKTFVKERPLPGAGGGTFADGGGTASNEKGAVDVDDAAFMSVIFENGALGSFNASRFAGGRKNFNVFEIYGSKGSIAFDLERMNELQYFNMDDHDDLQGFRTVPATLPGHPYVSAWWPPAHIIGYEHTFAHAVKDFLEALAGDRKIEPNLWDGVKIMKVLEAGILSDREARRVDVSEVK